MNYTSKQILHCSVWRVLGRFVAALAVLLVISCVGMTLMWNVPMANFLVWMLWAAAVFLVVGAITLLFGMAAFPAELRSFLSRRKQ